MADDDAVATEPTARRVDDVATTEVGERPAPSSSQPDPIGKLLRGTYRLERFIGEGGMGRVYEASHERLSRRFAVKLLGGEHSRNDKTVSRMEREADITSRLDHAHIVDVIDFDYADDGRPFIVMELLKGETLARRLQRERVISDLDHVEAIVEQVTSALAAAHGAGIVHRDLKPANIFLCRRASGEKLPFVKVMDFGISKDMHAAGHELTAAIAVLGTPPYMSPEQIQGRTAHADARADVFALGAVIFRMLGGAPPFRSDSKAESMFRQATSGKPIETPAWTRVAEPIRRVVLRALSAKPDARQVDAAELGRQMKAAIGEARAGGAARAHGETQGDEAGDTLDVPPRTRRGARGPSQRVTRLAIALAIASVVAAIVVAVGLRRPRRPSIIPPARASAAIAPPPRASASDAAPAVAAAIEPAAQARADSAAAAAAAAPDQGTDGAATSERVRVIASAPPTPRRARAKARPRRRSSTRRPARRRAQPQRAIAFGSLAIQSKSAAGTHLWANVLLDGKPVGRTPLTLERVRVGRHLVVARRAGYTPARAWVWVRPGQRSRARLRLSAAGR